MSGLTMLKYYLNEILDGVKTYDARSYPTSKRGTIALVDSKSMKVFGYVDLINVREITREEYSKWHSSGPWANCLMYVDPTKKYYAYDFINPRKELNPFKITGEKHTWVEVKIENKSGYQSTLF